MTNEKIIEILKNIAVLLELKGENPFKTRAYKTAADMIDVKNINVPEEIKNKTLHEVKGFGKAIVSKLTELVETGRLAYYEKLTEEVPLSLIEMTKLGGVGIKKVRQLWKEKDITSVEQLEIACDKGEIMGLKGFAEKTIEMIKNSIEHKKASKGRHLQMAIKKAAGEIWQKLNSIELIKNAALTGDVRRFTETITKIHFIIGIDDLNKDLVSLRKELDYIVVTFNPEKHDNSIVIKANTKQDIPVIFEFVDNNDYYTALHQTTGSEEYLKSIKSIADELGIRFENYKIKDDDAEVEIIDEADIYQKLNIQFIEPELRESDKYINAAKKHEIPKLIESNDMKGMIHVHSTWTDGRNSIKEMALECKNLGFEYMVLCDHSQSAVYANGLSPKRVRQQQNEIDQLNEEGIGIKILKGIESDILTDGSLDYNEDTLKLFDVIVASIHQGFKLSKEAQTKRLINAIKNPYTSIIGHPTGRLLTVRPEYELDIKSIIDCAADYGKVIEINCNPYRLDLSWENLEYAKEKGMKTAINPDSHRTSSLSDVFIGVSVARKGGYTKAEIINCLSYEEFCEDYVKKS